MLLKDILAAKGCEVLTITPDAAISDVVEKMCQHNCGSLIVCDSHGRMVGIISERDVLRTISEVSQSLDQIRVRERMTRDVLTGSPNDNVNSVMGLMTKNRIRHLPVLQEGMLAGLISIGDIVKAQHQNLERENHLLMAYIQS